MVTKQKILIVDDDNNIAELISLYLTKECFETRIVNDGEQALKEFSVFQPDLILLDLMLPKEKPSIRYSVWSSVQMTTSSNHLTQRSSLPAFAQSCAVSRSNSQRQTRQKNVSATRIS